MPWDIFKNEDGDHCVHKLTPDGEKGKKVSCHDSKEEAKDKMSALYASEDDSKTAGEEEIQGHPESQNNLSDLSEEAQTVGGPETPNMKMESYSQIIRHVSDAWYEQFEWMGYVQDVAPEHVIVQHKKLHWKVPYTIDNGEVSFADNDQWEKVEEKREWVAASKYAIKSINDSRIGAYAVIWGDEDKKDLHGEWFDEETEELKTIFDAMGKIPFLFHHGIDETVKSTVIGAVDVMEEDDVGLWYEAKIREFEAYRKYVEPLINRKALFTSSGTLPGAKRVSKSGQIKRWPIAEITGTHIPAEYRMLELPIDEIKSAYKSVGVDLADFEEKFANEDETQNEFETKGVEEARFRIENEIRQSKLQLLDLEII
jgi:hypothetical protein